MRTVDELKNMGVEPRVHGNGFLQLDLDAHQRLHVWGHPALPRQDVNTAIHDHRFGFVSKVLAGRLVNARYYTYSLDDDPELDVPPTHSVFIPVPREGEDTELRPTGKQVVAHVYSIRFINRGDSYEMLPGEYHETFSEQLTVTLMAKTAIEQREPRVLVPLGSFPDNSFNRHSFNQDLLWSVVADALDLVAS